MSLHTVPYKETGFFSELICDYLEQKPELDKFYNRFPTIENAKLQLQEKSANFNHNNREVLVHELLAQYDKVLASKKTKNNILLLQQKNTFTITTGHQLNLFTGPLYFLYKIVSTINLTKTLKKAYPDYNFVPVYWMATEDHDFNEINFFKYKGKKISWNTEATGAVGELKTKGLQEVCDVFEQELGDTENAQKLVTLFKESYLKHETLAEATRYLANELFKEEGLVIVDANSRVLKQLFGPYLISEIENKSALKTVKSTSENLSDLGYKVQVNPRDINLFYLQKGVRERIVQSDNKFEVLNTKISFTKEQLLSEIKENPERFSPNVLLRPLYQEVILPNICYIGGGGELAYWLQLKELFKAENVTFPMLLLRNSVLLINSKQEKKLHKLSVNFNQLFLDRNSLVNNKVKEISDIEIDFSQQKKYLQEQFKALYEIAKKTDASFLGAVKAQEVKQTKGLEKLEKRLLKAQKRKLKDHVNRLTGIHEELFPEEKLQERNCNFSEFYIENGAQLLDVLLQNLRPLQHQFSILII